MIIFLLFFLLSSFNPLSVHADDFDIHGDSRYSLFRNVTTMAIGDVKEIKDSKTTIIYDLEDLEGRTVEDVLENENFHTLVDTSDWRRIPGIADRVSGPPGTEVNILYHYFNAAGHDVEVSKVFIPFSRKVLDLGDWTNIVNIDSPIPTYRTLSIYFDFRWILKEALFKEYVGPGILESGDVNALILDKLTIVDPIKIKDVVNYNTEDGGRRIEVVIENQSNEDLENITFEHGSNIMEFTIEAMSEITLEYIVEDKKEGGYLKIYNPNVRTECAILGNKQYQWFEGEGVTVVALRENGRLLHGPTLQPEVDSFCISRTPYTILYEVFDENVSEEKDILQNPEILGIENITSELLVEGDHKKERIDQISILPKTGIW